MFYEEKMSLFKTKKEQKIKLYEIQKIIGTYYEKKLI